METHEMENQDTFQLKPLTDRKGKYDSSASLLKTNSGNFNEGNSQLLASSKPVKLTRMKISKFGKMYSFLGIFNSMRIQHFCSTAIYQKRLISPVRGSRGNCVEEEGDLGIWISAHSSKKPCNLKTGSLNSVSNFLCHKRKYSHETCITFLKSK